MVTGFSIGITQNSQSAGSNKSNVTVALTITWNGGSFNTTGNAAGVLNIDGTDYSFTAKFNADRKTSGSEVLFCKTLDIPHGTDGRKELSCSASFATGTGTGTVSASATKTLTQIPRESTVGATDANIGATSVISVSRKNGEYSHSVAYCFGKLKGYLADGSGTLSEKEVKLQETGLFFPIPERFYEQIPEAKSGECTLTVKTYLGDTQIGQEKSCTFTVTAPEAGCCPEVGGTVTDVNGSTVAVTGDEGVLIRGMSTARCTVTAQAKNGAWLKSKRIGTVLTEADTVEIENIESKEIVFSATDSRGYTGKFKKTVEMVDYVRLTCNAQIVRTDPTSGNARLTVGGNYFDGSFGAQDNDLQLTYQVEGGEPVEIEFQTEGRQYFAEAELEGLDYRSAHSVTVIAADKLMRVSKGLTVGKGIPVFDWGEQDFAFHVPVNLDEGINGVFMGSKYVNGVNSLHIRSQLECFDGTGKGRQTFFVMGCANGLPVHGLVGVWLKDGSTFISGTGIASAAADNETGSIQIAFVTTPWDTFTVISNGPFQII